MPLILETIVSTRDARDRPNFAPMGVALEGERILLRPFKGSVTFDNLRDTGEGVVHFTDDVLLFARCAVSTMIPPHRAARKVRGAVLLDACQWKEFAVESSDLGGERALFRGRVVAEGRGRDFAGLNRAKHAVIEATILATRLHLVGRERALDEVGRLRPLVDKTGGPQEHEAFAFIGDYIAGWKDAR